MIMGSVPGRWEKFLSTPELLDEPQGPPSLLYGCPGVNDLGVKPVSNIRISKLLLPLITVTITFDSLFREFHFSVKTKNS